MSTLLSYPIIPLAISFALGQKAIPNRLLWIGVLATILPGLNILAYNLDLPKIAQWSHTAFCQSIFFDLFIGCIGFFIASWLGTRASTAFWFLSLSAASHGVLYALTHGSLGTPFLWPHFDIKLSNSLESMLSPELIAHPVIPLAIGLGLGQKIIPRRLIIAGIIASLIPHFPALTSHTTGPASFLGIHLNTSYSSLLNNEFTRALLPAIPIGLAGAAASPWLGTNFLMAFWFLFLSSASYGVLEAISNQGLVSAFYRIF